MFSPAVIGIASFAVRLEHIAGMLIVTLVPHSATCAVSVVVPRLAELPLRVILLSSLDGSAVPFNSSRRTRR